MSAEEVERLAEQFRQAAWFLGHDVPEESIIAALCSGDPEAVLIAMEGDAD